MTNNHPVPLTPLDCDLRDFAFMPLDVARLRDSDLAATETPEACWAAVLLWAASWHQVPAASLPNDDRVLSVLAGYGRVVKEWLKVRSGALRGWIECSDGRLYHPVVAEKANDSWLKKLKQRWTTECARIKKHNDRHKTRVPCQSFDEWMSTGRHQGQALPVPGDSKKCPKGQRQPVPDETHSKGEGEREGDIEEDKSSSPRQARDDGHVPVLPGEWVEIFADEHGVDVDHRSVHDRRKFMPLAAGWVTAGVTVGQMRQACAKARAEATEPIAYLPAYADRVLATLTAPSRPAAVAPVESFRERDQRLAIERWEQATGQIHPDRQAAAGQPAGCVIDITPTVIDPVFPALAS